MHDYQLERLNTRSFEQLIQALGTEILGPQLMIFGDGPDGGREATFDGSIKYPAAEKSWSGYGIVQAKFRQQPDSAAKKNADWAIQQLKSEFAKLKPRPKRKKTPRSNDRICPEYYIFATNLALSPVTRTGGKDRVRAVLDGFKKSHGLKDYAIWDGDQIRRFLDAQPGIRTTYTAWLLPGDVLTEMMQVLQLEKTDFPSTIRRYLESELLDDQFARLGQGGYTDAKNIPLSSVFVDLPVDPPDDAPVARKATPSRLSQVSADTDEEKWKDEETEQGVPPTFLRLFFEEGRQVLKPSAMHRQVPREGRGKQQDGRVVLIGGPGQGKTTIGQFACQLLRAALLQATGGPFSSEVSQALERIEKMSDGLPSVCARRYPLRVDLKHLASSLAATSADKTKSLFDYLRNRIASRTNSTVRQGDFRRWLGAYPWVLVLDGLDEVPASSNRQQVMQAIRDFVSVEAHDVDADLLVLATTRPQGYSDEFDPSLYRHLSLAPLNGEQALAYGSRLATARHPVQRTRIEELTASLEKATTNPATVRLMQSPLQVTIMLVLIEGGGQPPEQRWKLFHDYYDAIYRREKERGTEFSPVLGSYEPDIHWIHHRAGWLLQQRNAKAGGTDARLSHKEFEEIVDGRLQSSGHENAEERRALVETIRRAATDRLVLLVGNTEKEIGFEIRSLQEFMAAEHFFDGGEAYVRRTLHDIAPFPYWRNVFLFVAGRIFFEREELKDRIFMVCGELNEALNDPAQETILSGSRLALALLKDGAARNQPASIRMLARCAARGLDVRDNEAVLVFSELFSGEAEDVWKEELSKRLTTTGSAFPYHNWFLCLQLVEMGKPWARELMMSRFPWESEEALRFVESMRSSRMSLPEAFWAEFSHHLFSHPLHLLFRLFTTDGIPNPLEGTPLSQFVSLFQDGYGRQRWPLSGWSGSSTLAFGVLGRVNLSRWEDVQYPEIIPGTFHLEWRVSQTVSAFAREPTKVNLVEQLRAISQIDPEGASSQMAQLYPWQIAICMRAKNTGRTWHEIISGVEAGNIGAEGDWTRWEGQGRNGINLSQFRFMDNLCVSDDIQGLILQESSWLRETDRKQDLHFAEVLSDALARWPELRNQNGLVGLCCFDFYLNNLDSSEASQMLGKFITTCSDHKVRVTTPVLAAVLLSSSTIDVKRNLLAKVGSCPIQPGWLYEWDRKTQEANKLLGAIIGELLASDEWWKVLRALSFLPPLDALEQIPDTFLEQLRSKGEPFAKAASSLRLNGLRWQASESATVVGEALALKKDYPDQLEQLFEFIDLGGKSGPHLEAFLVELIKQYPLDFGLKLLKQASEVLVKLVERRPAISSLPDPAIRQAEWR